MWERQERREGKGKRKGKDLDGEELSDGELGALEQEGDGERGDNGHEEGNDAEGDDDSDGAFAPGPRRGDKTAGPLETPRKDPRAKKKGRFYCLPHFGPNP